MEAFNFILFIFFFFLGGGGGNLSMYIIEINSFSPFFGQLYAFFPMTRNSLSIQKVKIFQLFLQTVNAKTG